MARKKRIKRKTTDIEKKVGSFLRETGVYFKREHRVDNFHVDFFIPSVKVVIQTDGCYWHYNKCDCNKGKTPNNTQIGQMIRDKSCNGVMRSRGYKVLRLWGCRIRNNWEECKEEILQTIKE